ncbi:Protein fmp52, mitochondrial [Arthroderma sp. PD_2]|nr:Protein fmp52, mitochondrial [Arthroderma sp. PD_2]
MATTAIVGGTGLVGSRIVNTLLSMPTVSHIGFLARREPSNSTTQTLLESHPGKLSTFISTDLPSAWCSHLRTATPVPEIFFSSMATTRANAGGLAPQRALEHDANVELARAAKEAGARVYVLISATGADKTSIIPYNKLKGDIEQSIIDIGFEKTVIVRPGMISGQREVGRPVEGAISGLGNVLGWISQPLLRDWWTQDASVIARAAVSAAIKALQGAGPEGQKRVLYLGGDDIVRLGRTEWEET